MEAEPELTRLYRRSLLTLELLTDRETGATIAAPELDPDFVHSGGYGFVWPRDLAFVVLSFLAAERPDLATPRSAGSPATRRRKGSGCSGTGPMGPWRRRGPPPGRRDGIGAVRLRVGLARVPGRGARPQPLAVGQAGGKLPRGLPRARDRAAARERRPLGAARGQHSYTAAATAAGLDAAAAMAARHEPALEGGLREAAERVRAGIESELWSEEHGRYLRTRWVGRRDGEGEPVPPAFASGLPYPNRAVLSVDALDARVDSSLLGLAWPFRAVDPGSERMRATAAAIERALVLPCGGVLRHEGDDYAGGNPWLLTTLWLGLYYRQLGDEAGLRRCVDYALSRRTQLDLLPEQADREGQPAWVLPLAWSHAMLVLAARPELAAAADPRSSYPAQTLITGR